MKVRQLIGAAVIAAGLVVGVPAVAAANPPPPNPNQVEFWCPTGGVKYENASTPFVVPDPPAGMYWTLLVLKAGNDETSTVEENETFPNPVPGQSYVRSDGKDISHAILCQAVVTTTTTASTTTTSSTTTTTTTTTIPPTTTTTIPGGQPTLFAVGTFAFCDEETGQPFISITFGNRPDLDGQTGTLFFSDFTSMSLTFDANATVTFPYPASRTTPLLLVYVLNAEIAGAVVTLPADCPPVTTTTTTVPPTTTTVTSTVTSTPVTTLPPGTTLPR